MSTLYETSALPLGSARCIRVLEILPTSPSPPPPLSQASSSTLHPILRISSNEGHSTRLPYEPLQFRLKIVDLDNDPHFTALSYVWGDRTLTDPFIRYGASTVSVTQNCYSALLHLRNAFGGGGLTIWVDAICINQDDQTGEKEAQLLLMGEIYSRAERVYVWLGEGTSGTDRAMRYLDQGGLSRYYCEGEENGEVVVSTRFWAAFWNIYSARWINLYPFLHRRTAESDGEMPEEVMHDKNTAAENGAMSDEDASVDDLEELLSSRWITRLWTYQEIFLAEHPLVVCGKQHTPWSNLERSIMLLTRTAFYPDLESAYAWKSLILGRNRSKIHGQASHARSTEASYQQFVQKVLGRGRRIELNSGGFVIISGVFLVLAPGFFSTMQRDNLIVRCVLAAVISVSAAVFVVAFPILVFTLPLRFTRWRKDDARVGAPVEGLSSCLWLRHASEPKDMAFGVWAILQKIVAEDPLPKISYMDSLSQTYRTLTTQLIGRTRSLQLLYMAASKGLSDAPSWVPDWSTPDHHQWDTSITVDTHTDKYGRNLNSRRLRRHREHKIAAFFEFDAAHTVLTVQGRHVCDIGALRPIGFQETEEEFQDSEHGTHLENLRIMLQHASHWRRRMVQSGLRSSARHDYDDITEIFPYNVLWRAGKSETDPWYKRHEEEIIAWTSFCRSNAETDASEALSLLRDEDSLPAASSILATQIMMSNLLARKGFPLFQASITRYVFTIPLEGICGRNAEVGDHVVRVVGVPQLLVLRTVGSDAGAVRIVCPAVIRDSIALEPSEEVSLYRIH